MDLQQYVTIMKERWGTAMLAAVLVLAAVCAFTLTRTPVYTATNRVFVQTEAGGSVSERNSGADFASQQIITYADLATTPLVLDPVIDELDLDLTPGELADRISTDIPEDTLIIDVTASSIDPSRAAEIANATSESLRAQVSALETSSATTTVTDEIGTAEEGADDSTVELTVISPATAPDSASSPNVPRDLAVGVALALLAAVAAAVIRDFLDNRLRRPADVEALFGRPVVGTIPTSRLPKELPLIAAHQPQSIEAESYRELRTNLQFMLLAGRMNTILVTSSLLGEGKSSSAINLAQTLAQAGSRVLLIDADLRRPALASQLGLERMVGLTTVLIGEADLEDVSQPLETDGLDVLTSGPIPPNPSELLGSDAMRALLGDAAQRYDYVVVDSAPVLAVTDAVALSRLVDGTLLVTQCNRTTKQQIGAALAKLDSVDARVLGVIANRAPRDWRHSYTYEADEGTAEVRTTVTSRPTSDGAGASSSPRVPADAPARVREPRLVEALSPREDSGGATPRTSTSGRRSSEPRRPARRVRRDTEELEQPLLASGTSRHGGRSR